MATKNAYSYMIENHQEVIPDKWKTELNVKNFSDISISWIGHMVATPTQFFTNFFKLVYFCNKFCI